MPDNDVPSSASASRFEAVLAEIIQAEEQGQTIEVERYCRSFPELARPLRDYFRNRKQFVGLAPALAPTASSSTAPQGLGPGSQFAGYKILRELGMAEWAWSIWPDSRVSTASSHWESVRLVQKAWEARDYGSVRHLLLPGILAKHEKLLQSMREHHEINRIDDLRLERLEFVHLYCPQYVEIWEATALITFQARVYFVDDRTGAYTRGPRSSTWFQEFWVFRRRGETWLLQDIEESHLSDRLERPNYVAELTDQQLANAQSSIAPPSGRGDGCVGASAGNLRPQSGVFFERNASNQSPDRGNGPDPF
jgi:hypothetical protein